MNTAATFSHPACADLASVLGIPERTLARVVARAEEVFGDMEVALSWLKAPNAALLRVTPLSLLGADIGAESVMDTLGRIEHGVFA